MITITRCPACQTAFRVQRHQLEARQGHVRCGACGTVFDGRAALEVLPEPEPALEEPPHHETAAEPVSHVIETEPAPSAETESDLLTDLELISTPGPEASSVEPESALRQTPPALAETPEPAPPPDRAPRPRPRPMFPTPPREEAEAEEQDFEFVRARGAARRRTWLWAAASLPLALLLAAQGAYFSRSEIAALYPASRPWFDVACAQIGCTVALPRHIESLVIEFPELQAESGSVLVFRASLRNKARFAQGYPALELSLTGLRDELLTRRVLAPREYLPSTISVPSGIPAGAEVPIRLAIDASALKVAGYRAYIFYP